MRARLAGVVCELDLPSEIEPELAERYAGYLTTDPVELTCAVRVIPDFTVDVVTNYPVAHATCDGGRYRIRRKDLDATLDLAALSLEVTARPYPNAVESALRVAVSLLIPRRGGLLLHSSGVVHDGRGYVFSGRSGAGKTTTVRLLAPRVPLGDDLVALIPDGERFRAHSTPFAGEYGPVAPRSAPLERLYFLEQSDEHRALPLSPPEARTAILRNTLAYVRDPETAQLLLDAAHHLATTTPCATLRFARDGGVAAALRPFTADAP